jgi:hypothetical protein
MKVEGRSLVILVVLVLITIPAAVLRLFCVGRSCEKEANGKQSVPFCSLPPTVREMIGAGYREGRSPDVLAVTRSGVAVIDRTEGPGVGTVWPSLDVTGIPAIPVAFGGPSLTSDLPSDTAALADISPTLATLMDFAIPHPEVRSGRSLVGQANDAEPARMALVIVFRDLDPSGVEELVGLGDEGWSIEQAQPDSLPVDPAALLATIGTGGSPAQHGVTGTFVRNDRGDVVRAWSGPLKRSFTSDAGFPGTIIATLADDLDDVTHQRARVALVAGDDLDRGLIGGNWYVDVDRDLRVNESDPSAQVKAAESLLEQGGFGNDQIPDVLALSVDGRVDGIGRRVENLTRSASDATGGRAVVVALGFTSPDVSGDRVPVAQIVEGVERETAPGVVERTASGGLFLDQQVLADEEITKDQVVSALRGVEFAGRPVFADAFPGIAVSFARFC